MNSIQLQVISYDKDNNVCRARIRGGHVVEFDPFVSCAVELSDEDYFAGRGAEIVGNEYSVTEYHYVTGILVPLEMHLINQAIDAAIQGESREQH